MDGQIHAPCQFSPRRRSTFIPSRNVLFDAHEPRHIGFGWHRMVPPLSRRNHRRHEPMVAVLVLLAAISFLFACMTVCLIVFEGVFL